MSTVAARVVRATSNAPESSSSTSATPPLVSSLAASEARRDTVRMVPSAGFITAL